MVVATTRKRLGAVVAVCVLAGSACTKSGSGNPSPGELADALLTVTDLDSQWNETQRQVFDERGNENPSLDPSMWCPDAKTIATPLVDLAGQAGADVEMEYKGLTGNARMLRQQAWSNADAKDYLATIKETVTLCDGKKWTDESGATTDFSNVTEPDVGDEAVSWSSTLTPPTGAEKEKYTAKGHVVVVRFNDVVMVLQAGDFSPEGTGKSMTDAEWLDLVDRAVAKVDKNT